MSPCTLVEVTRILKLSTIRKFSLKIWALNSLKIHHKCELFSKGSVELKISDFKVVPSEITRSRKATKAK